jgi:hypothetical protein
LGAVDLSDKCQKQILGIAITGRHDRLLILYGFAPAAVLARPQYDYPM